MKLDSRSSTLKRMTSALALAGVVSATVPAWAQDPAAPAPAPAGESKVKPPPPKQQAERHITTPVVVSAIVSGVAIVTGTVFAVSAASQHSKYTDQPDHQVALDGESAMLVADVSFGVGALFGITALALYFLPDEPTPDATHATTTPAPRATSWVRSALTGQVRF